MGDLKRREIIWSHFVQVKRILKFNLADGLENIMELINEKVKTKKK